MSRRFFLGAAVSTAVTVIDLASSSMSFPHHGDLFALGVASGDPSYDGVVLWTRLTRDPLAADGLGGMPRREVAVDWEVASDQAMRHVVRRGTAVALPSAATRRARRGHRAQARGRVLLPLPCRRRRLAGRPDRDGTAARGPRPPAGHGHRLLRQLGRRLLHRVPRAWPRTSPTWSLHLGDYIYEYAADRPRALREHLGGDVSLADYRLRHAQHRTDPDLQAGPRHRALGGGVGRPRRARTTRPAWSAPEQPRRRLPGRPARRRLPGLLRAHAAAPRGRTASLTAGSAGARSPPSTCSTPGSTATTKPCGDGVKVCAAAVRPEPDHHRRPAQEAWLDGGLAASTTTGTCSASRSSSAIATGPTGPRAGYSNDAWDGYVASRDRLLATIGATGSATASCSPATCTSTSRTTWRGTPTRGHTVGLGSGDHVGLLQRGRAGPPTRRRRAAGREPADQVRERPAGLHPRAGLEPGPPTADFRVLPVRVQSRGSGLDTGDVRRGGRAPWGRGRLRHRWLRCRVR